MLQSGLESELVNKLKEKEYLIENLKMSFERDISLKNQNKKGN